MPGQPLSNSVLAHDEFHSKSIPAEMNALGVEISIRTVISVTGDSHSVN